MASSPAGSPSPPQMPFMAFSQDSSSSLSSSKSLPTSFNISHHFPTTMDKPTYLCWRSQFLDILTIHDLLYVISPNFTPPSPPDSSSSPSSEHILWLKTDRSVLSWIKAMVAFPIQTIIISCTTTREAWDLLSKCLSPVSKIHIRTLRDQLRTLKKTASQTMVDYLLHAKSISDSLPAVGAPLSDSDLIEYITNGLGLQFKEFVTSLHF